MQLKYVRNLIHFFTQPLNRCSFAATLRIHVSIPNEWTDLGSYLVPTAHKHSYFFN